MFVLIAYSKNVAKLFSRALFDNNNCAITFILRPKPGK